MRLLALTAIISVTSSTTVTWLGNSNYNLPSNFKDGKIPCSKQTVIFPESISGAVRFQSDNFASAFILPSTGEMLLEGALYLGADPKEQCEKGNKYFIDKTVSAWGQPDVWASPKFNEATPDAERVPCSGDTVDFPAGSAFSIVLPDVTQSIKELTVSGERYNDVLTFAERSVFEEDSDQKFFMNSFSTTGLAFGDNHCKSQANRGCPCQELVEPINCDLKFCAAPVCSSPIKPIGHCCKICGGTIAFERQQSFNYMEFNEFVDKIVASYDDNTLVYHAGIIPPNKVQVVIVEKGEYTGLSTVVANDIDNQISNNWYAGVKALSLSGSPLSSSGSSIKIVVSVFFVVVLALGAMYAYYYKIPTPRVYMPSLPTFGRGSTAGLLSRFDRRTDSILSLTRRDSAATVASGVGFSTAFRNPLYDSKRGRVDVIEAVDDENM